MNEIKLIEHPEGGRYKEVYRSESIIKDAFDNTKSSLTHIYFSLNKNEISHFHKVTSDEVWNLYKGTGLYLYDWDGSESAPICIELSEKNNSFCHVIPAGHWQAAIPIDETVLVGCSVAPGFEFADFALMNNDSKDSNQLLAVAPEMRSFIIS